MMEFKRIVFALFAAAMLTLAAPAPATEGVKVANAWVRAALPGQGATGAYLELTSASTAALVAAGSPVAKRTELHTTSLEGGVMRMRPVSRIDLPAGQAVSLAPGGLHIMLIELVRPLKAGETVPLVLSVQAPGGALTTLRVEAQVRPLGGEAIPHRH